MAITIKSSIKVKDFFIELVYQQLKEKAIFHKQIDPSRDINNWGLYKLNFR